LSDVEIRKPLSGDALAACLSMQAADYALATARAQKLAGRLRQRERGLVDQLVIQVRIEQGRVVITWGPAKIAAAIQLKVDADAPASNAWHRRATDPLGTCHAADPRHDTAVDSAPDQSLTRLLAQAHRYLEGAQGR
jgi:hypothetical protein